MSTKTETYRVIETIDSSTVVIDRGKLQGAKIGQRCKIHGETRKAVNMQKEFLGDYNLFKGEGRVTQTYEKFCIVRTISKIPANGILGQVFPQAAKEKHPPFEMNVDIGDFAIFEF